MNIILIIIYFSVPAYSDMRKSKDLIADVVTQVADDAIMISKTMPRFYTF